MIRSLKFLLSGGVGYVSYLLVYYLTVSRAHIALWLGITLGLLVSILVGYTLNYWWAFADRKTKYHVGLWKFSLITAVESTVFYVSVLWLSYNTGLNQIASSAISLIVRLPVKYALCYVWVFRSARDETAFVVPVDYEWEAWYRGGRIQRWWKHSLATRVLHYAQPQLSPTVLDLGCGTSPMILKIPRAIGVDIDRNKLLFLKDKIPNALIQASAEFLPFKPQVLDVIIMSEVIEHLHRPDRALRECYRSLKHPGRLVVATPDNGGIRGFIWNMAETFTPYRDDHQGLMDRETLDVGMRHHGFEIGEYSYIALCDLIYLANKQ